MNRFISIAALVISIVALFLALNTQRADERIAQEMIDKREQQLIEALWPDIQKVCKDIGVGSVKLDKRPSTLEELLAPLFETIDMGGG